MKIVNLAGIAMAGIAAFASASSMAETINVSCSWVQTNVQSDRTGAGVTSACSTSSGELIATRLEGYDYSVSYSQPVSCEITTEPNINFSGSCQNPSFTKTIVQPESASSCNVGHYLGNACANSFSSPGFGAYVAATCGAGCSVSFENLGWTSLCPHPGSSPSGSPELAAYCAN